MQCQAGLPADSAASGQHSSVWMPSALSFSTSGCREKGSLGSWPVYAPETAAEALQYDSVFRRLLEILEAHAPLLAFLGISNLYKKCRKLSRVDGTVRRAYVAHERHFAFFMLFTRLSGALQFAIESGLAEAAIFPSGLRAMALASMENFMAHLGALARLVVSSTPSAPALRKF